ncbi:MAG: NADH-quinone oxidoreductase subunit C [Chthoniobacterales bacterium]
MTLSESLQKIEATYSSDILDKKEFRGEVSLSLSPSALHNVCAFCREKLGFDMLLDVTSVDHFGSDPRFEIVYELYSLTHNIYLRLKTSVSEDIAEIVTVSDLWATANWHEREVYDMMGIKFTSHPDLRRILMWEGYPFYPLRKDFPLEGKPSEMPDIAFSDKAPLQGGPFVTSSGIGTTEARESRHRSAEENLRS